MRAVRAGFRGDLQHGPSSASGLEDRDGRLSVEIDPAVRPFWLGCESRGALRRPGYVVGPPIMSRRRGWRRRPAGFHSLDIGVGPMPLSLNEVRFGGDLVAEADCQVEVR